MKMLRETSAPMLEVLTEQTATGKKLYLEGPFLLAERYNRNRRRYSRPVMESAVDQYIQEYISERRALGELNHPDYPFPDPRKAAIMTQSLDWKGDEVIGKALVLNTPDGEIIKALLDAEFKLGVSSRGLGDVNENRDGTSDVISFLLNAIDAVDLPSGQTCYVNSVNESVSWVQKNGVWIHEMAKTQPGSKPDRLIEALDEMFKTFRKSEGGLILAN
jgi:hypothetical protein